MGLEYVYAALLLHELGKDIDESALSAVLKAAGVEPDPARVKQLVEALQGVDIDEVIKSTAVAPVAVAAPAAPAVEAEEKPAEEKKEEEKKKEEEEEAAIAGLGALFG